MLKYIKQWLQLPIFPNDEEKNRLARLVNTFGAYFALLLILNASIFIPFFVTQKAAAWFIIVILFLLYGISRIVLFRGLIELSSIILTIGAWIVFQCISISSGGVNGAVSFAIIATIIILSLFIQTRISYIIVLLSILIELVKAILQTNHYEFPNFFHFSPMAIWFWFTLTIGFVFSTVSLISHNLQDALKQAHHECDQRKQIEQALRQSEERFQMFMQYFPGLAYMKDAQGQILFANQGFQTYLGIKPEEMLGKPNEMVFGDEFGKKINHDDQFVLESGTSQIIEEEYEGKNWTTHKFCIKQEHGKTFIGGISIDTTARKQAELSLKQTQEQFRAVVQTANEAIITINENKEISFWNNAAEKIFGFGTDEMLGKPFAQFVPLRLREINENAVARVLKGGEMRLAGKTIEVVGLNREGKELPIEMSFASWQTQNGHFITAIIRDISKRKRAEKRMEQSEKKYRELFQLNNDGITIVGMKTDAEKQIFIEINEAAHNMLGYSKEEMLQLSPDILEPDLTIELLRSRQNELKSKGIIKFETILTHKNGQRVHTEFSSQSILYDNQPSIMNIIHNITDLKQHEHELETITILSSALRTASNRSEMLPKIVEQIVNQLNCDTVTIELIDRTNQDSVIKTILGTLKDAPGSQKETESGINSMVKKTTPFIYTYKTKNYAKKSGRNKKYNSTDVHLIAQEKLIGYIRVERQADLNEGEVRLLSAIANIAANAIHRTTLHEQAVKAATELTLAYDTTLEGWAHALELRDHETEGHARRVVQMTLDLACAMGISENELEDIRRGAILHDIGKMGIPDSVLLKTSSLNEGEWEIMQRHPSYAYELLTPIRYLNPTLDIPYCHHEKWDGTGYPRGLKGEDIPFAARIFTVVDVWDALTSNRPYRLAWSKKKALEYIIEQSGKHFDPNVVEVFLKLLNGQI